MREGGQEDHRALSCARALRRSALRCSSRRAVGRVVRPRSRRETATVFLPAVRPLLALAASMEEARNHVVQVTGPVDGCLDDVLVERLDA